MVELALPRERMVIVVTGYQFSGKTTIGREIARLTGFHHLDDDTIRHALFPQNKLLKQQERREAYQFMREVMVGAAEFNLKMDRGVVISSTFGSDDAKKLFLTFWFGYQISFPFHLFRLVLPEEVRESIVKKRAVERYGTDATLLARKLEGYEYMRQTTTPWPGNVGVVDIDASQSVDHICQLILEEIQTIDCEES